MAASHVPIFLSHKNARALQNLISTFQGTQGGRCKIASFGWNTKDGHFCWIYPLDGSRVGEF